MDGERFDALTTTLSSLRTRRVTLGAAAGSLVAAVLGREDAAAKCVKIGKKCKGKDGKEKNCCGGAKCHGKRCRCVGAKQNSGGVCGKPPTCLRGFEACDHGTECCSSICNDDDFEGCAFSGVGLPCYFDSDCVSNHCAGFLCKP